MQLLITFYEDNKLLAMAAAAAAVLIAIVILFLLYRLLFGRRLRAAGNGRVRQPRLGIVDAYDLDRQRQLVLVRRDNVEHLIMIGGPTDVVIESSIVRAQQQPMREKEAGPAIGPMPTPTVLPGSPPPPALAAVPQPQNLAVPGQIRSEPSLSAPRPVPERPAPDRSQPRMAPAPDGRIEPMPIRGGAPNGQGQGGRPLGQPQPPAPVAGPGPASAGVGGPAPVGGTGPAPSGPGVPSDAGSTTGTPVARPPLPQRIPPRQPLPPRGAPGSPGLARPTRPILPRSEPGVRPESGPRPAPDGPPPVSVAGPAPVATPSGPAQTHGVPGPGSDPEPRRAPTTPVQPLSEAGPRRLEPPPLAAEPPPSQASGRAESLESLEEEMAKLLGRPIPRRDG